MTSQGWLQIGLTLLIGLLISIPVGRYLARVVTERSTPLDRVFDPIDNFIYLLIGRRICGQAMDWKAYTLHMLATNLVMALIIFLILVFQDRLPLNPQHFAGMEPVLAFNTAVSFITNTDWQGLWRRDDAIELQPDGGHHLPDVHLCDHRLRRRDGVHPRLHGNGRRRQSRQFLPRSDPLHHARADARVVRARVADDSARRAADPRRQRHRAYGAGRQTRPIALGPVASLETIKHMGTNGGGFFNANASHPFENPTPHHQPRADAADDRAAELDRALLRRDDRQPPTGLGALRRHGRAAAPVPAGRRRVGTGRHAATGARQASRRRPARASPAATWKARKCASASSRADCSPASPPASRRAA